VSITNYGELKTLITSTAHRKDQDANVGNFIELAEANIARNLRANEMETVDKISESDRRAVGSPPTEGIYNLPDRWLETRDMYSTSSNKDYRLDKTSTSYIHEITAASRAKVYATYGKLIQFRGIPDEDQEFTHIYYQRPVPFVNDSDTNNILLNYPDLYLYGGLYHLYLWTQDLELAQNYNQIFVSSVETINEQADRARGGAGTAPAYNLGNRFTSAR